MPRPCFIRRLKLRNYKSIAACDIRLGPLTYLVGPNGAGKSNLVDALRLVMDALDRPLESALRERGGIDAVRRRSTGHPHNFAIALELELPGGSGCRYALEVASRPEGAFSVKREECSVGAGPLYGGASYVVEDGQVVTFTSAWQAPAATPDRLFLVNASGVSEFRPVYEALTRMGFYNFDLRAIRDLQPPDPGERLARDGRNLASVLGRLAAEAPDTKQRIEEFLANIAPGIRSVDRMPAAHRETLEFRQDVRGAKNPWRFFANSMSDGTLRALGILVALFQSLPERASDVSFVAIEEPEMALHPGAAEVVFEALREASEHSQVLVTTHSPDLLDFPEIAVDEILAVEAADGVTRVGRLDEAGRGALQERLYTPGELLRMSELRPEGRDGPTTAS